MRQGVETRLPDQLQIGALASELKEIPMGRRVDGNHASVRTFSPFEQEPSEVPRPGADLGNGFRAGGIETPSHDLGEGQERVAPVPVVVLVWVDLELSAIRVPSLDAVPAREPVQGHVEGVVLGDPGTQGRRDLGGVRWCCSLAGLPSRQPNRRVSSAQNSPKRS